MAINDLISGLAGALAEVRAELVKVDQEITDLSHQRQTVIIAPPHTDDIVASLKRGLAVAAQSYEERLAWNLNDANATSAGAAQSVKGSAQLLMINAERPAPGPTIHGPVGAIKGGLFPVSSLAERQGVLDVAAVTYFLRDRIEAEIPALVKKLCPASQKGMRQSDRDAAIKDLSAQITALKEKRVELASNIAQARKATGTAIG